jgi:acyl CoA:acetate/3-ketoacid CoA transferase
MRIPEEGDGEIVWELQRAFAQVTRRMQDSRAPRELVIIAATKIVRSLLDGMNDGERNELVEMALIPFLRREEQPGSKLLIM